MNEESASAVQVPGRMWAEMLDAARSAVVVMDGECRVAFWNRMAESVFGRSAGEAIGRRFTDLVAGAAQSGTLDAALCDARRRDGDAASGQHVELIARRRSGDTFPLGINIAAVAEGGGGGMWLIAFMADITARKAEKAELRATISKLQDIQTQLLQAEKMASIGQLAAGVAHEINNPVGYVYSNLGSLRQYVDDLFRLFDAYAELEAQAQDSTALRAVRQLKKQLDVEYLRKDVADLVKESIEGITRVTRIVQDLKDFSRVDEAEWQWADLHRGLDSTLNIARNEIKYKAEVVREYGDLPQVECLVSQINQVFMNLMVNAAQAIDGHGRITLRTGAGEPGWVWVEVRDTGKGIPEKMLNRIFDPFFTTKPVGKGTGLGLSLAYSIVNKHHGRIEVESEVGSGTTFRVVLPIRQPLPQAEKDHL